MGEFSWMFADTNNKKALNIGSRAFVACPDGSFISEPCYNGYGIFGGMDIYDLAATWNRDQLDASMIRKPRREMWADDESGEEWYRTGLERYGEAVKRLYDWKSHHVSEAVMAKRYGREWKRNIGIDIACEDDQNAALPYPIKIVFGTGIPYGDLPSSDQDENQGWGSDHWE